MTDQRLVQDPGRVRDLSAAMAEGRLTAEALVRRCLDRIAAVDGRVRAWAHAPAEEALAAARALAALRRAFWAAFAPEGELILVPVAPGVAPGAATTGGPSFVIPAAVLGGPVATLRSGLAADSALPVGALPFGPPGSDARLAAFLFSDAATRLDL